MRCSREATQPGVRRGTGRRVNDLPLGLQPFNGYRKLHCVLIPISLGPVPSQVLTWFDKFVYGRLRFEARNSDRCRISFKGIAEELGVSKDSVSRSVERLADARLIHRKQLQYASLIIFLASPLLEKSIPKSARSGSAELPTLNTPSGSATLPTLKDEQKGSESAGLHVQGPQSCGAGSAELRSVYKEFLGFSFRNKEDYSSSTDASESSQNSEAEIAAAAPLVFEDRSPEEKPCLEPEDSRLIAAACCEVIPGVPLSTGSPLIPEIWELALKHGCTSVAQLVGFIRSRRRRHNWKSQGIWLKVIPFELSEYLAAESAKPPEIPAQTVCPQCHGTGLTEGGHYCSCEAGIGELIASAPVYSVTAPCRKCCSNLKWSTAADSRLQCAFCQPTVSRVSTAQFEKLQKLRALSQSDNEHEARLAADHVERLLTELSSSAEAPTEVAVRMGATVAASTCKKCWDAAQRACTGIRKSDWDTVDASASFCDCAWGAAAREAHPTDYPEQLALNEREWILQCQEFQTKAGGRSRSAA